MVKKDLLGNILEKLWHMEKVSQVMNINYINIALNFSGMR